MAQYRRTFVKAAGVAGVGAFAGCLGKGESGGGDNTVNIALAPDGLLGIVMDHIHKDTEILANAMDEVGYTANVKTSWEDSALFAAGGPDFSTMSSLEAAQLAGERDKKLAVIGRISPQYMGWMVKTGGKYDPGKTGSVKASIGKLVSDKALIGIGAWNGGHVPSDTLTMSEVFNYNFDEEGGDFKVTTADYVAIPTLVHDGKLAAGSTSPEHGAAKFMLNDPPGLKKLFWGTDIAVENDLGMPQLNSLITNQQFINENKDAATAMVSALTKGLNWLLEDPVGVVTKDDHHIEQMGVDTAAQAKYIVDWGLNLKYDTDYRMMYDDPALTDDFIESDGKFIDYAAEIGFVPDGWRDRIVYEKV